MRHIVPKSGGELAFYIVASFLLFLVLKPVANHLAPIVVWMKAEQVAMTDNYVVMRVSGYKVLNCELYNHQAFVRETTGGRYKYDPLPADGFTFRSDHEGIVDSDTYSRRSIGAHDFGFWEWDLLVHRSSPSVFLEVHHNCDTVLRRTGIGPFPVEQSGG